MHGGDGADAQGVALAAPYGGEQFTELRPLERVEAAGGSRVLFEDDRVLDSGLVQDEVLPGGRLLVRSRPACGPGSSPKGPFRTEDRT